MPSIVAGGGQPATSIALPAVQVGDMIVICARGTAAFPSIPAAGGSVPAWTSLQQGLANAIGLTVVAFVATAATTYTSGTFTNATHIMYMVLRPTSGSVLSTAAARSSSGNGNNTQTIVYPALTFTDLDGSSFGVRFGTRTVAVSTVNNPPTGWTYYLAQPVAPNALLVAHTLTGVTSSPASDSVATTGTNAPYRAVTIEILEVVPQTVSVPGLGSPQAFGAIRTRIQSRQSGVTSAQAFGTVVAVASQKVTVAGVPPTGRVATITATATKTSGQTIVGGKRVSTFGPVSASIFTGLSASPAGVGSPQAFGVLTIKAVIVRTVSGVGSAQAFGAVAIKGAGTISVAGVPSAQAFGITAPKSSIKVPVAGKTSAQAFGAITIRTGSSRVVPGVPSAQAFGAVKAIYLVHAPGLGSPAAFGVLQIHTTITIQVGGVGSAQAFGSAVAGLKVRNVWIWPTTYFPSTGGVICGFTICGDGHAVGGWDYLPASGRAATVELEPHEVSTLDLVPTLTK